LQYITSNCDILLQIAIYYFKLRYITSNCDILLQIAIYYFKLGHDRSPISALLTFNSTVRPTHTQLVTAVLNDL